MLPACPVSGVYVWLSLIVISSCVSTCPCPPMTTPFCFSLLLPARLGETELSIPYSISTCYAVWHLIHEYIHNRFFFQLRMVSENLLSLFCLLRSLRFSCSFRRFILFRLCFHNLIKEARPAGCVHESRSHILLEEPNRHQLSYLFVFVLFVALKKRIPSKKKKKMFCFVQLKSVLFNFFVCVFVPIVRLDLTTITTATTDPVIYLSTWNCFSFYLKR